MHTAKQLKKNQFKILINGATSTREQLFPEWNQYDRFGVVVDQSYGAVGASLLLQLAITAFYDVRPSRRENTLYPEVYLFHVGGKFGSHASFDIYPPRKEVFVDNNPAEILEAINDRGITRLAVVDGPIEAVRHHFKEPASAMDRIVSAFSYAASGRVNDADIEISALDRRAIQNTKMVLHPKPAYTGTPPAVSAQLASNTIPDGEIFLSVDSKFDQIPVSVSEEYAQQRKIITVDGFPKETYRRISIEDVLRSLHSRKSCYNYN